MDRKDRKKGFTPLEADRPKAVVAVHDFYRGGRPLTGFTLLELLLAISLFCIVAVAINSSLAVGIKAHRRGGELSGKYNDVHFACNKFAQDLRTAVHINNVYLVSEAQKIYFYSVQPSAKGVKELCRITYSWDDQNGCIVLSRLKESYADSLSATHSKADELLDRITKINFDYGYIKRKMSGEVELQWNEEWKAEFFPKIVRMQLKLENENFEKIIYCPAGKMAESKEK